MTCANSRETTFVMGICDQVHLLERLTIFVYLIGNSNPVCLHLDLPSCDLFIASKLHLR